MHGVHCQRRLLDPVVSQETGSLCLPTCCLEDSSKSPLPKKVRLNGCTSVALTLTIIMMCQVPIRLTQVGVQGVQLLCTALSRYGRVLLGDFSCAFDTTDLGLLSWCLDGLWTSCQGSSCTQLSTGLIVGPPALHPVTWPWLLLPQQCKHYVCRWLSLGSSLGSGGSPWGGEAVWLGINLAFNSNTLIREAAVDDRRNKEHKTRWLPEPEPNVVNSTRGSKSSTHPKSKPKVSFV